MSAQSSAGIQTLLDAEKKASQIVQEVRTKRVKQARDEAKKEIDNYRARKDAEFQAFTAEHSQGNKEAEAEAQEDAQAKIAEIKESGKQGQVKVVGDLLSAVFDVKPVAPSAA
ncbi:hypothetical protein Cpir12675_000198 [Ceratocystis pirilliformis]|uniref:V-type proton ATPase subunit G n=1 Tax=Ceratocystis pirilliformis TaxID=259994 RepID=A0ABR3ZN18_9PEZI